MKAEIHGVCSFSALFSVHFSRVRFVFGLTAEFISCPSSDLPESHEVLQLPNARKYDATRHSVVHAVFRVSILMSFALEKNQVQFPQSNIHNCISVILSSLHIEKMHLGQINHYLGINTSQLELRQIIAKAVGE